MPPTLLRKIEAVWSPEKQGATSVLPSGGRREWRCRWMENASAFFDPIAVVAWEEIAVFRWGREGSLGRAGP